MQTGIPEFVHIRNYYEMQEFLVILAYSGIKNISSSHPHTLTLTPTPTLKNLSLQ
jgi:3-deoxy-D-arabino-heptulosonate 7-phosphate (DAHP) synthase